MHPMNISSILWPMLKIKQTHLISQFEIFIGLDINLQLKFKRFAFEIFAFDVIRKQNYFI